MLWFKAQWINAPKTNTLGASFRMISTLESELITLRLSNEFLLDSRGNGRICLGWVRIVKHDLHFWGLGFAEASDGSYFSKETGLGVAKASGETCLSNTTSFL